MSNEVVKAWVEVTCLGNIDDDAEYSFEFDVSSIVFSMFVVAVLEIWWGVSDISWMVDSSNFVDEIRSISEFELVVNIDVLDVVEIVTGVVTDVVDNSFICSSEESVWCNDISEIDGTNVEVGTDDVSTNNWVAVVFKIFVVVPLVDIGCNEDNNECSVELETFWFIVEKLLVKDSDDFEPIVENDCI